MVKIIDIITDKKFYGVEIFPPRNGQNFNELIKIYNPEGPVPGCIIYEYNHV